MLNTKLKNLVLLAIVITMVNVSFQQSIQSASTSLDLNKEIEFDQKIKILMKLLHSPSLVLCIIKNNSIAFLKSYGFTDFYLRKKSTNDTIYLAGSISKTVTATALMQLYEKGHFNLDEDVSKYLPFELKNPKHPNVNITFRMLLSHQTSLSDFGLCLRKIPYMLISSQNNGFYPLIKEMLVPDGKCYNKRYWSNYPPGNKTQYSELGVIIAGYLVEIFSGQSFENYCQEHIFQPLNMTNTSFDPCKLNQTKLSKPYALGLGRRLIPLPKYDFRFLDPPAGLWTNVEDLSHFFIAHMNGGEYKGNRILEEDTVKQMHTKQYPNNTDILLKLLFRGQITVQHGLGWQIADLFGTNIEGHTGGAPGYNCHMYIIEYKENKSAGAIILTNGPFFSPAIFSYRSTIFGYQYLFETIIQKINEV